MTYKVLLLFLFLLSVFFLSCDDSGVIHSLGPKGKIAITHTNLKPLDPNNEGMYEAWLRLDTASVSTWYSLGRFNISSDGSIVDYTGAPMVFNFNGDTNQLDLATVALVSIESPGAGGGVPGPARLLSTVLTVGPDSIYGTLTMGGDNALGAAGRELMRIPPGSFGNHGQFIVNAPTGSPSECRRGIWFCDNTGGAKLPVGIALNPSGGWVYEGWIVDKSVPSNPVYYSTGRFFNPDNPDLDGAGPCSGPNTPYSKPGQDWILSNCPSGKPPVTNLSAGYYDILITLEIKSEQPPNPKYGVPFYLTLFYKNTINPLISCGYLDYVFNQNATFPKVRFSIVN